MTIRLASFVESDPINVFFDNTYLIGTATTFPEFLGYMLETEDADKKVRWVDCQAVNCVLQN